MATTSETPRVDDGDATDRAADRVADRGADRASATASASAADGAGAPAGLARLCDRVSPPRLPTLAHPDVATWRPVELTDVDVVTALQKAMDAVDHPDWTTPREDVEDELDAPHVTLTRDSVLAVGHDGEALAWGLIELMPGRETRVQAYANGGVHPRARGRGIGRVLLAWLTARGVQQIATCEEALPAWVRSGADERNRGGMALHERLGFVPERYFTTMERDLVGAAGESGQALDVVEPPVPDGVRLVPYSADRAQDALDARNDAFRDHWGSQPRTPQEWATFVGGELFRADLSWLAVDEADVVLGFALVSANPEDWELQGYTSSYLGVLGVVRAGRRRGIAPALLARYLRATRDAGLDRAVLDVDTANPSGALGLYERAGFVATNRSVEYVLEV